MKDIHEPSISMSAFYGKIAGSSYRMALEKVGIKNLYTHNDGGCGQVIDPSALRDLTVINSIGGGLEDDSSSAFLDPSWGRGDSYEIQDLKSLRCDTLSRTQCAFLGSIRGLEKLYLIDTRKSIKRRLNGIDSPVSSNGTPSSDYNSFSLKDGYIQAITNNHGDSLRHLLLPPQWRLGTDDIALIVRRCPHLEQLGFGVEFEQFNYLRLLVPFLPKLRAIRLLANPDDSIFGEKMRDLDARGVHEDKIGTEPVLKYSNRLQFMALGDLVFRLDGGKSEVHIDEEGKQTYKRKVRKASFDDVKDIEIWALDSADI